MLVTRDACSISQVQLEPFQGIKQTIWKEEAMSKLYFYSYNFPTTATMLGDTSK